MGSRTEAAIATVQRRDHTGELADLVVQSETRAFRAHRDIVFEQLPCLRESCITTPEDCFPFFVQISAPEQVVDTMLRHVYQLDVVLPFEDIGNTKSVAQAGRRAMNRATRNNFIHACDGLLACTKYGLDELSDRFERAILNCMFFAQDAEDLIFMAYMASSFPIDMIPEELFLSWGFAINAELSYIALVNLAFEVDRVMREPRGLFSLESEEPWERIVAQCGDVCARNGLQRGASGPGVDSAQMRHFLIFCADMLLYDVTKHEVEELVKYETKRRKLEAAYRRQRKTA